MIARAANYPRQAQITEPDLLERSGERAGGRSGSFRADVGREYCAACPYTASSAPTPSWSMNQIQTKKRRE